ncbi:MAG: acetyl-CoA carboxylase biotin carboxylase subunit [Candidatus Marinimicrobia bacterium]|nr:acetyl-CoA carboxylase biotin carboxylase subunit [Candidatus Neomarinimicrobiota bacterium]
MIKKVLIANRGEIALRVIRACKELGLATVAVYSTMDKDSLAVTFADEAVCIGPAPSNQSYLKASQLISAAEVTNADAIHPGYGFFSENSDFAKMCRDNNITFIGPSPEIITAMGNKAQARKTMQSVGVPVIPGSDGVVRDYDKLKSLALEIGYPVLLKASSGGGGRGMRIVNNEGELKKAYDSASAEAEAAFGDPDLYMEKLVLDAKHIEVQILADQYGNVASFGERDCSVQRRHQKLIEESPSPIVDEKLRTKFSEAAKKAAGAVHYNSAGTVEFLLDRDHNFYFIEMNTRIQVEHCVTEMISGYDLVKGQIRVHRGEKLPAWLDNFQIRGHAIECRINAEDPEHNFRPSPGEITSLHVPGGPGVRFDSHIYAGYIIPPTYDSLIGKLITHGENREEAIQRMQRALEELTIGGIATTIPFHQEILKDEIFKKGDFHTGFLNTFKYKKH